MQRTPNLRKRRGEKLANWEGDRKRIRDGPNHRAVQETLNAIRSSFGEDTELSVASQQVSLLCPIYNKRMTEAARGENCTHFQCFDLGGFLQLQSKTPHWDCPVSNCKKELTLDTLVIDEYFNGVLQETDDTVSKVELLPNGTWQLLSAEVPLTTANPVLRTVEDVGDGDMQVVAESVHIAPKDDRSAVVPVSVLDEIHSKNKEIFLQFNALEYKRLGPLAASLADMNAYIKQKILEAKELTQTVRPLADDNAVSVIPRLKLDNDALVNALEQPVPSAKRAHMEASDVDSTAVALKARAAVLEDVGTSLNDITKAVIRLPCRMDSAARARIVAMLSQVEAKINAELGIKKKSIRHVLGSDPLPDIFAFLSRRELDALQLVDARFNDIIANKMSLLCLRQLVYATLHRGYGDKEYTMSMRVRGAKSFSEFPTGETDAYQAFVRLLSACRSSRIGHLEMDGNATIQPTHLDAVARYAPSILVDTFRLGSRSLSKCVSHDDVRRALGSFAELKTLGIVARHYTPVMLNFLVRNAYMFELAFYESAKSTRWTWSYPKLPVDEASLLAFSFGECEQRYAGRERRLTIRVSALSPLFLQRWIERAELAECQLRSSLGILCAEASDVAGLSAFTADDDSVSKRTKFASKRGRSWTAVYEYKIGNYLQLNFN